MSTEGIKLAAKVFSVMQETRIQLLGIASTKNGVDKQDLLLAQMLEVMKEASKDRFMHISAGGQKMWREEDQ